MSLSRPIIFFKDAASTDMYFFELEINVKYIGNVNYKRNTQTENFARD